MATRLSRRLRRTRRSGSNRDLERRYRASLVEQNILRIRAASLLGFLALGAHVLLQKFLGLGLIGSPATLSVVLMSLPAMLVAYALAGRARTPGKQQLLQLVCAGIGSAGVLMAVLFGLDQRYAFPAGALLLLTIYLYSASGLQARYALALALTIAFAYVIGVFVLSDVTRGTLFEAYYLLLANAIGAVGSFLNERNGRRVFLHEEQLSEQASRDSLSGLLNRAAFHDFMERAWGMAQRDGKCLGLMLLDLDHFKQVNDTAGHKFGDDVVQTFSQALLELTRRSFDCAGRYGGDEFIAVWYDVDETRFREIGVHVREALCTLDAEALRVGLPPLTVSGGAVHVWPGRGIALSELFGAVDAQLYEAKRAGRNRIAYEWLDTPEPPAREIPKVAADF